MSGFVSAVILALAITAPVARAETVAGVTAGALSVESSGAARYAVPIDVPPGVAGMEPDLSLVYSSGAGNGLLGLGWSLGGLSVIHRCARTLAQDGVNGGVNLNAEDRFCLDGQRLVAVSGAYGADGTEYRTEIDGFARIFSYGTAGTGPESFTVETKSRRILEYGVTADSRVEQQGGATVRFWALNRVFDPMGNIMDLVYDENTAGQTFKILRIDYAGNSAAGTTPQSQVAFVYESRPDHRSGYLGGSVLNTTERLRRIETWTDGALVREYRLTYDMSQRTGRSRLRSITECEAAGDCLRPIAFTWTWAAPGWASAPDYIPPYDTGKNATRFVDVNGDGLIDVVWKDGAASQGAHINTGSGWQSDPNYVPPYDTETDATLFVDVNGDGLVDVVWNNGAAQGAHINTGSGWQSDANYIPPHNTTNSVVRFAELNGDGLPDLLWRSGGSWGARINTGTGWQDAPGYAPPYSTAGITARVEDLNGDGLADFTYWFRDYGGGDVYGSYINNGSGWTYAPGYAVWATNYEGSHIVDVNGDGLPDNFHWFQESGSDPRLVALNTGTRFITAPYYPPFATSLAGTHVEDINGDGLPDMLVWQQKTGSSDARGAALNTGNGWASEPAYNPPTPTNNTRTRFHDVNGDGLPDFIWKTGSTSGAQLNTGAVELLSSITDSLGRVTTIDFAPLTDPGVYTKGTGAVFPEIDLQVPLYVVAEVSTDDGVGGQARETYAYEGLKLHLQGRGALGFAQMTAVDQQTGITTVTTYRQDFPFIGGVETSETRLADGTMVRSLANTWEETLLNGGLTSFPHVSASTAEGYEINDGPGNAPITATTTTTLYDDFGNPTSVVATTSGGGETFKTETVNSYTNDTLDWFLGQLDRAEATNTLPDLSAETRVAAFAYDPATGLLTREVIEPDQAAFTLTSDYTHDLFGNLLTETVSGADIATRVTTSGFSADGRFATSLTNDLNHGETRDFDHRFGTVTLLTGPNDITTTWDYDGFGRKVREARADGTETRWGYDLCVAQCPPGGVYAVSQQDFNTASGTPIGARAVEYFDLLNRSFRAETEGFDGTRIFADTEFNERGEVVATSRPYFEGTDPAEVQKATATHDVISRVLSVTQPDEGVESVTYAGLTTTSTNALNQSRTRRGNARGELVEVVDNLGTAITYSYDPFGNLEKTDAGGVVTTMDYDVRGLKTFMDDPDMGQWSYAYNVLGELTSQTDAKGQSVELFYDSLGRLTRRIEPEGTTDWTYDTAAKGLGKLHTVSAPHSAYSMIQNYDGLGRPSATTTTIDGVDYSQAMTYDGAGRPETLTYPSGFAVRNSYNARGYLLSVSEEGGATVFWEADTVNAEGQVTQETFGNGVVTSNAFDPRTGLIDAISTDLAGAVIQDLAYSFDKIGNLEQRADLRQDRQEDFNYDGLNRLTSTSLVDTAPSGGTLATTGYTYDALGNLTSKSDVGTFSYGGPGAGPHAVTGAGEDGYLYDANGNMTSLIAGGATHGPSVLGARTQTAGSFFPDVLMAGFTVPEGENRVLLVAVSHEEGTIGSVTFGGQPLSQVGALVNDETGVALFELREAQLGPGAQTADLEVDFLGFSDTEVTAFTVTGVDQAAAATIAQAAQPVAASSISADITTSADTAILVSAVGLDSPAIWSPGAGETQIGYAETGAFAGGASYEVVAAGSHDMSWSGDLALRPTLLVAAYPAAETGGGSSVEKTIAWSSFNKPTLITEVSTGDEAGFTYGPDRARIRQHVVEGGAARDVIYIGSLYERRIQLGSPDELVHYVVAGGTVAIHTVFDDNLPATNRTRYLHRDHLGSIETITGETGAVVQRLSFDAHGQRRLADWTAGDPAAPGAETPRGFTGHEHLDAVGLIHMNGRVYDPVLGRFLSADPIVPDPETTKSFNRYTYVHNNPLSFTDPSGFGLDGPTDHGHGMDQGKDQASGIGVSESYGGGRGTHGGGVGPHGHKSYGADARNEPMDHRGFLSSGRGFAEALGAAAEAAGLGFAALDRWGDDVLGLGLTHPANIEDDFYTARNKGEIRKAIGLLDRARRFGVLPGKISQMVEALQHAALQGKGGTKGVAYVGGALDETLEGFAFKAYLRAKRASSAAVSATVNVAYFSWDEPEELADFIEAHKGAVAVFGHSYGADTAAAVVAAGHRVELLVTVDPVSNFGVGSWFGPSYSQVQLNARTWRNYNATKGDLTFGNVVAGLGGSWDGGPRSYSKHFDRPYNHGEIMAVCGSFLGC